MEPLRWNQLRILVAWIRCLRGSFVLIDVILHSFNGIYAFRRLKESVFYRKCKRTIYLIPSTVYSCAHGLI